MCLSPSIPAPPIITNATPPASPLEVAKTTVTQSLKKKKAKKLQDPDSLEIPNPSDYDLSSLEDSV